MASLYSIIWFKNHIPYRAFQNWSVCWRRFATKDRLGEWRLEVDPEGGLCKNVAETQDHLSFASAYSR